MACAAQLLLGVTFVIYTSDFHIVNLLERFNGACAVSGYLGSACSYLVGRVNYVGKAIYLLLLHILHSFSYFGPQLLSRFS